jgi:hypothetical protein
MLLIQNPGEAPTEGFTLLGVSTTRNCGVNGTIGQFGSGTKHAINVLLRAGLQVVVYCGRTKMEFKTREDQVSDGLVDQPVQRVYVQFSGTSTKKVDLGWVLDFGAIDWTELGMALREFVSNAIDRTLREEYGQFEAAIKEGRLAVRKVSDAEVRAKSGYTRVFITTNTEVDRYLEELPKRFLHFSGCPGDVRQRLLPKADRNLTPDSRNAMIYREGVFVRELKEQPAVSLYDYNFQAHEIQIDESRNSSEYAVRAACARSMKTAEADELVPVFRSLTAMEDTFEAVLDPYYLCPSYETPREEQQQNWQRAWEAVAGDSVMCEPTAQQAMLVQRKGKPAKTVKSSGWAQVAQRFGITTSAKVLTDSEVKGREPCPVTPAAKQAVETAWSWVVSLGMTGGREMPKVACYRDLTNAEEDAMGYYRDGTVHIREDIASGENKYLLKTAFEEVVHHITQAGDSSRDVQNFLIDMIIEIAA